MSSKKRKPGRASRKSSGQKTGPRKPRGGQGSLPGGDLGSVRERDATLKWVQDLQRHDPGLLPAPVGLSADDEISVIFSAGSEQPDGAGPLIGETRVTATMEDGTVLPPGTQVWLSSRNPGDIRAAAEHTLQFGELAQAGVTGPPQDGLTPRGQPRAGSRDVPGFPGVSQLRGVLPLDHLDGDVTGLIAAERKHQEGEAVIPPHLASAANEAFSLAARDAAGFGPDRMDPALAAKLAKGLSPEELADPAVMRQVIAGTSKMPPGAHMFSLLPAPGRAPGAIPAKMVVGSSRNDGGPGLPEGMQPGDIIAAEQPRGYTDAGIELPADAGIPPGSKVWRPDLAPADRDRIEALDRRALRLVAGGGSAPRSRAGAELIALRDRWPADEVLSQHAWLTHHYRNPADPLADYLAYLMRDAVRQDRRVRSMYWPVDLSGEPADRPQGRQLAQLIARGLGEAATYQVTAPMCRKMRDEWDAAGPVNLTLDEGRLPAPAGFVWLDQPWLTRFAAGYWLPVRAVSWERTIVAAHSSRNAYGLPSAAAGMLDSARLVLWLAIADDVAFGRWGRDTARADRAVSQIGRLVPIQTALLPFGAAASSGGKLHTNGESLLILICTLWAYLGMMLPKSRPVRAGAPAVARRARASLKHDEVHIITLREYDYVGDSEPRFPKKIDWQSRWWVNKFHRHIDSYDDGTDEMGRRRRHAAVPASRTGYVTDDDHDLCAVCLANGKAVRIAEVRGFLKGPPGKPIQTPAPGRTLYKLTR